MAGRPPSLRGLIEELACEVYAAAVEHDRAVQAVHAANLRQIRLGRELARLVSRVGREEEEAAS